jgi:DNA-binding LytR/AlgR family response regulator
VQYTQDHASFCSWSTAPIRVHRSYIVNKHRINRIEDGMVIIGQHKVPIGDSYRDELMRSLKIIS